MSAPFQLLARGEPAYHWASRRMGARSVAPDLGLENFPVPDPIVAWFTASTWLVSTFSLARTRRHGHRLTVWSRSPYDAILDNDRNARSVINASSTNPTSEFTFTGTLERAEDPHPHKDSPQTLTRTRSLGWLEPRSIAIPAQHPTESHESGTSRPPDNHDAHHPWYPPSSGIIERHGSHDRFTMVWTVPAYQRCPPCPVGTPCVFRSAAIAR